MKYKWVACLFSLLLPYCIRSQEVLKYQMPAKELAQPFISSPEIELNFSKDGKWILYLSRLKYPSVDDIAFPSIELTGLAVNAQNFARISQSFISSIAIKNMAGVPIPISGLPPKLRAGNISWSPDGKKVAFTQT